MQDLFIFNIVVLVEGRCGTNTLFLYLRRCFSYQLLPDYILFFHKYLNFHRRTEHEDFSQIWLLPWLVIKKTDSPVNKLSSVINPERLKH